MTPPHDMPFHCHSIHLPPIKPKVKLNMPKRIKATESKEKYGKNRLSLNGPKLKKEQS